MGLYVTSVTMMVFAVEEPDMESIQQQAIAVFEDMTKRWVVQVAEVFDIAVGIVAAVISHTSGRVRIGLTACRCVDIAAALERSSHCMGSCNHYCRGVGAEVEVGIGVGGCCRAADGSDLDAVDAAAAGPALPADGVHSSYRLGRILPHAPEMSRRRRMRVRGGNESHYDDAQGEAEVDVEKRRPVIDGVLKVGNIKVEKCN